MEAWRTLGEQRGATKTFATALIHFFANPGAGHSLEVGGAEFVFVVSVRDPTDVEVGGDALETATQLAAKINEFAAATLCTATAAAGGAADVFLTAVDAGAAGNNIWLSLTSEAPLALVPFHGGAG